MDIHLLAGTRLFHGIREHEIDAFRRKRGPMERRPIYTGPGM